MKVFQKISASRSKVDDKSIKVDDLFFNKKKIFSKDNINEVIGFLKEECVNDIMCKPVTANMIAHHFNNNLSVSRRFMFVCASLVNKKGQPLFDLFDDEGMTFLKIKQIGVLDIGEDKPAKEKEDEKQKDEEPEEKTEPDADKGSESKEPEQEMKPEDINKDGKVDEEDLSAVHKEYSKEKKGSNKKSTGKSTKKKSTKKK